MSSRLGRLKIRDKLTLGFGVILALILAMVLTNVVMINRINARARFVEEVALGHALLLVDLEGLVKEVIFRLEADVAAGSRGNAARIDELRSQIEAKAREGEEVFRGSGESLDALRVIARAYGRWYAKGEEYLNETIAQNWENIGQLMKDHKALAADLTGRIVTLRSRVSDELKVATAAIERYGGRTKGAAVLIGLLSLAASVAVLLATNRAIMGPVAAITSLMRSAERGDYTPRYENGNLLRCWEVLKCGKKECGAFGSQNLRCWQITGTHCQGEVQGDMAMKLGSCEKCEVYKGALGDEFTHIGEALNNMLTGMGTTYSKFREATGELLDVSTRLGRVAGAIREGNVAQASSLSEADRSVTGMDGSIREITETVEGYLRTAEQSSSAITEMSSSIGEVAAGSERLSTVVERTMAAIEELFASIRETARGVDSLSGDVTDISGAITEMGSAVRESEKSARQVHSLSEQVARGAVHESMEATAAAIGSIEKIRTVVSEADGIIQDLGSKSQDIGQILKVIREVSDQTNLLALNAAIIAAQAGEHGRGFSVVAEEVRQLSERTASSTKEIAALIESIRQGLSRAVEAMRKGSESIEEGIGVITDVDVRMKKVEDASLESSEASRFIVRSTSEQATATERISQSSVNISDKARQIAGTAREQAATCDDLTRSVTEISAMMEQMRRATAEQSRTAKQISESTRKSTEVVERIEEATRQEAVESSMIVKAMQEVKEVSEGHLEAVSTLRELVQVLADRASSLDVELAKVRID